MSSAEVAVRHGGERAILDLIDLRTKLDMLVELDEVKENIDQLKAIDAYARAKGAKEITNKATEVRVWTERRAGEIGLEKKIKATHLARQLGVSPTEVSRWFLFARVEKERLEQAMARIAESRELSLSSLYQHLAWGMTEEVRPGIWLLPDGRYRVYYKHAGVVYRRTCKEGGSLKDAQTQLHRLRTKSRGSVKNQRETSNAGQRLSTAYGAVRTALGMLGEDLNAPPDVRDLVEEVMAALYKAEDKLGEARKKLT